MRDIICKRIRISFICLSLPTHNIHCSIILTFSWLGNAFSDEIMAISIHIGPMTVVRRGTDSSFIIPRTCPMISSATPPRHSKIWRVAAWRDMKEAQEEALFVQLRNITCRRFLALSSGKYLSILFDTTSLSIGDALMHLTNHSERRYDSVQ